MVSNLSLRYCNYVVAAITLIVALQQSHAWEFPSGDNDSISSLSKKLLDFCKGKVGQKVGNGQCTAMVQAGLRSLGVRKYPNYRTNGDFQWGTYIGIVEPGKKFDQKILPGDILQFRNVVGRNGQSFYTFPVHTAVVGKIERNRVHVYHQNVGSFNQPAAARQKVQTGSYDFADLKKGWIKVYRPSLK